ncbi:BA14K family protein [Bartonella pachyuromydis]|uniref:Lectin-like protein BA14k n=1 Tax=Bartonella pachyuromydis TaxID=931097 RepID=A0ABP8VHU0_9HYPH
MKKIIKLAVLSAISNVTAFMPLSTTLASSAWGYREDTITKTMKSIEKEIDDHMKGIEKEIDDHMKRMKKDINSRFSSNSFPTPPRKNLHRIAYTGGEYHHRNVERRTYHYSERNTTTHHHHTHKHYESRNNSGEAIAAGLLGLAAGVILNNVFKKPEQPQTQIIYQKVPQAIYQQTPTSQVIYEVQSITTYPPLQQSQVHDWLQYCKKKYRSFNPKTGTFRGSDGREYICYAPVN